MDFTGYRILRILSAVVLFFFLWTFGGVFDIAYAVKNGQGVAGSEQRVGSQGATSNESKTSRKFQSNNQQQKTQRPEEKFQKAIEDIEKDLSDTGTDTGTKKNKLKTKKSEIETLDVEIRKQFDDTGRFPKGKRASPGDSRQALQVRKALRRQPERAEGQS